MDTETPQDQPGRGRAEWGRPYGQWQVGDMTRGLGVGKGLVSRQPLWPQASCILLEAFAVFRALYTPNHGGWHPILRLAKLRSGGERNAAEFLVPAQFAQGTLAPFLPNTNPMESSRLYPFAAEVTEAPRAVTRPQSCSSKEAELG